MRAILQRVTHASVEVSGEVVGKIDHGIMALIGLGKEDNRSKFEPMIDKIINMRIFPNEQGRFDRSLIDCGGALLLVPQFTLFADTTKGRRPEFFNAMHPTQAQPLFEEFVAQALAKLPQRVASGVFGADMNVSLLNQGPVTISIEL